ncbi:PEP-CTERM sorting domain-containing protein [Bythopirellula polymerisocia]|uniref:Ice-binding protein C-terminal domain-containing protein n=1 Tax=Bythopirellula polymerisocia TaxID=2528003 RepID=A0A5C6D3T6_9BACT|nr:PEP-CTERM sorting domain-containing protein [Bythopirellula polymerisocia]TWU30327.1 hypothetical protein Pla144_11130 [Bythopirellula polymerisocia]
MCRSNKVLTNALTCFLCKTLASATLFSALCCTATLAQAAIMYGDFSDTPPGAVMYLDVTESSFSKPVPPPLYGPPSITGNVLDFDPTGFGVSSSGGASGLIDGQLNYTIMALPGAGLTGFSIVESGDFSFSGVNPSPGTFVSASAGATVSILAVDSITLPNPIPVFASDIFVTDYPTTGGAPSTGLLPWSLVTFVDLGAAIPFPFDFGATKVEVAINNQLSSATTPGNQAAIAKKDFKLVPVGDLIPDNVPEPSSLALVCLIGLFSTARRRVG